MDRWIADTVPSEKYPLHSRANAGEVMPDPVSPLSSSWALGGRGEWGWRDAYVQAGTFDMTSSTRTAPTPSSCSAATSTSTCR